MADPDAVTVLREMIAVLEEHFAPLRSTLLDGTFSCRDCRCLVLNENEDGHSKWHIRLEEGRHA